MFRSQPKAAVNTSSGWGVYRAAQRRNYIHRDDTTLIWNNNEALAVVHTRWEGCIHWTWIIVKPEICASQMREVHGLLNKYKLHSGVGTTAAAIVVGRGHRSGRCARQRASRSRVSLLDIWEMEITARYKLPGSLLAHSQAHAYLYELRRKLQPGCQTAIRHLTQTQNLWAVLSADTSLGRKRTCLNGPQRRKSSSP